jgi:hypothetical protein
MLFEIDGPIIILGPAHLFINLYSLSVSEADQIYSTPCFQRPVMVFFNQIAANNLPVVSAMVFINLVVGNNLPKIEPEFTFP